MTAELKLGINVDVPNDDYHADRKFFSSTCLKELLKDRELFYKKYVKQEDQGPRQEKGAFSFGSYIHTLILEPHLIDEEYVFFESSTRSTNKYKDFRAQNLDKTVILEREKALAQELMDAYNDREEATALITNGVAEQTLCVEMQGVPIKVRADYVNVDKGYIVDVKTTSAGTDRDGFIGSCDQWGYFLSAALYAMAFKQHFDKNFDFYWVVLGKFDKQCHVYKMSLETMKQGIQEVKDALTLYKKYTENDSWFDYQIEEI